MKDRQIRRPGKTEVVNAAWTALQKANQVSRGFSGLFRPVYNRPSMNDRVSSEKDKMSEV